MRVGTTNSDFLPRSLSLRRFVCVKRGRLVSSGQHNSRIRGVGVPGCPSKVLLAVGKAKYLDFWSLVESSWLAGGFGHDRVQAHLFLRTPSDLQLFGRIRGNRRVDRGVPGFPVLVRGYTVYLVQPVAATPFAISSSSLAAAILAARSQSGAA